MRNGICGATSVAAWLAVCAPAGAAVLEDFETGAFGAAWVLTEGDAATVGAAGAHDGSLGVANNANAGWYVRTDVSIAAGDVVSAWTRPGAGRFYLGFGATLTDTFSFVLAPNTGELIFQDNYQFDYYEGDRVAFAFADQWYRVEVAYGGGGQSVGRVYDDDGTTLLAELITNDLGYFGGGGVAVRGFYGAYDTIALNTATVPEPAAWAVLILGFGVAGASLRRRALA